SYIAILIYLGYSSSRKQSSEGFLIADRNLKALDNAATIIASKTGAGVMLTFVALYYLYGISAMWIFIGVSVGYILFIPFAVKLRNMSSSHEFYTYSDYFFHKHGKFVGYLSALAVFVVTLFMLLIQLIGGTKILTKMSGFSFSGSLIIIVVTILVYTVLGGFKAVVKTDKFQILSIILLLATIGFIMAKGSFKSLVPNILSIQKSPPLISMLCFFAMGMFMPFFSAELWQRIYAAKDVRIVKRSLILSALVFPVLGFLLAIIGVSVSVNLKGIDPDLAMMEGLIHLVPAGFLGLGMVIFFASIMSSADSVLFASISILLQDFYARSKPVEKDKLVTHFRYAIGLLLIVCFFLSVWLQNLVWATYIGIAFGCVVSVVALTSWWIKSAKPLILICGMASGFMGTFLIIMIRPVNETLILVAIGLTILGLFLGSAIDL
ncbi:hypothetical protein KA005_73590, partial [bacterium]|nr:hypothetical protein [bacterium]